MSNLIILKKKFVFLLLFSFSLLLFVFSLNSKVNACPTGCGSHTYCGCVGTGGCVYRSTCRSSEVRVTCPTAGTMCCDRGICVDCTPSCGTGYQSANNGCSSATFSCTKYYCIGGSCGTKSTTCYRIKYTVSANGNGGTCSPASQSLCGGTASSAVTCSRSGYTFNGFTLSGSCGGTFNSSTGVCSSVTGDITITANWTPAVSYTVTVAGNGGTCTPGTHSVSSGSSSLAQTCTRTGYTFSSFSITSGSCGGTFNSSTGVCSNVTSNITITANWSINSYYVSVNGNGGTCSPGSHYVNYGSASSSQTCSRTGYTFSSFTITSGSCLGFNTSTGVCPSVRNAITIRANWSINSYYVSVSGNGGTCSPGSHYVNYGSASSAQTCTRTGYTFSYFSITSGSCGGSFNTSTGVCSSVTSAFTMTAYWSINSYLVSVSGNGGTCSPGSHYVDYGSASSAQTCSRTDYNFTGFTSPNPASGCSGTFNSITGVCSSVIGAFSITAQWEVANHAPTTPTTPYCIGTTNPTDVTTQTPYFSAIFNDPDTNDQGVYYEIEVNTASGFGGTVMWDTGIQSMTATNNGVRSPDIYYNGSSLGWSGTTYYWRIRFWDNGGLVSPWSAVQNFKMHSNSAPTAPTNLQTESATNPIQVTDTTPEFRAIFNDPNTGDTGIQYEIEVNTASDFTGTIMWDSGLQSMTSTPIGSYSPQISYSGTTLTLNGATYYWRIRFVDNYGYVGAWSATANFRMNNIPTATNPKTNGQTNPPKVPMTPYFTAVFNDADTSATGTYYEVEVNTTSNFAGTVMWDTGQTAHSPAISNGGTSSNITYGGSALSSGVLYYWRIRFWDNAGTPSNWSTTSNFRTTTPPSSPTGLLVDGQTNPTGLSTFTPPFSAIHNDLNGDSATYYEIEVNSSSAFDGTVMWDTGKTSTSVNNGSRSPDYIYAGTPLTGSGTTYYWRIRFWDVDDNTGAWSATATFRDSLAHFYLNGLQMNGIRLD